MLVVCVGGCLLPQAQFEQAGEQGVAPDGGVVTATGQIAGEDVAGAGGGTQQGGATDRPAASGCVEPSACGPLPVSPDESAPSQPSEPEPSRPDAPAPADNPPGPTGEPCQAPSDCQSGVCGASGCGAGVERCCQAPSCSDGVANGSEPVADCGNAACGACPLDAACTANVQCATGSCRAGTCQEGTCPNDLRDGTETDTDCGGPDPNCPRCSLGFDCSVNTDCVTGSCVNGACSACNDGERNGTETGVDCGGVCGPCDPGQVCTVDADCQSGVCENGRCCGGNRVDCTRCARRLVTAINCNSNGPAASNDCNAFLQCLADNSDTCPTRYAPGCSEEAGSVCFSGNFGGDAGPGVALADAILGTAQCLFAAED